MWRPLEGPLPPTTLRQALIILRSLFEDTLKPETQTLSAGDAS